MRLWGLAINIAFGLATLPASAQSFNQFIAFGDSTIDTGWFAKAKLAPAPGNPFDAAVTAAVTAGGNAHFTGPGQGSVQILAGYFGLAANAANTPGGTNFAIGGALNSAGPGAFSAFTNILSIVYSGPNPAVPATTGQISNYLGSVNGQANPNALYLVSSGGNSVFFADAVVPDPAQRAAYFSSEAQALASSIASLQNAGARYIIVSNEYLLAALTPDQIPEFKSIQAQTWTNLSAAGVKFIPADTQTVIAAVTQSPAAFGITAPITENACNNTSALTVGSSITCLTSNLVAPDALQTHLYIDGFHLTQAGNQILADYYYGLVTAPSQISLLAENAVKTRLSLVNGVQGQIQLSQAQRGPAGFNVWVGGDVSAIRMDNYPGFPNTSSTVGTVVGGLDKTIAPGLIAGFAISSGAQTSALGANGNFKQRETSGSLYAAYQGGPFWGNFIGTYGYLDYKVNRVVPIGITLQSNSGATNGSNWSAAFQGGYKLVNSGITHGPVLGLVYQYIRVNGFTESGGFTSLGFGQQTRESAVGQIGYRASFDWSIYHPYAQLTWNAELADTNRNVTAFLTTVAAPGYSLPAVQLGKGWGAVDAGVAVDLHTGVKLLLAGTANFSQSSASVFSGRAGVNFSF